MTGLYVAHHEDITMTRTVPPHPDRLLAVSEERDLGLRLRLAAWRDGWDACLDHFADMIGGRVNPTGPSELEITRYGPGGRAHFADPRPQYSHDAPRRRR
jgi:hypothetical protein